VSPSRRVLGALVLLGALSVLAGCKAKQAGTVSGTVKYKGNAVTTGTVNFFAPEKGVAQDAKLDGSGNFKLAEPLEAGTYKVYFLPPQQQQLPPGQVAKKEPFDVPPKYQDMKNSGLSREVKAGKNEFTFDLTD